MSAAAGVLFVDGGRVLLVEPSYKQHWDIPGGIVEPGESPRDAAAREVKEELGLTVEPGRLLVVDAVVLPNGELLTAYIFDGHWIDTAAITVDAKEIVSWAWCGQLARTVKTQTAPIFRRRVTEAVHATILNQGPIYLESRAQP
jgi:8-oxo-dGTP diphosphatase